MNVSAGYETVVTAAGRAAVLSNGRIEVTVALDVGPRVLGYRFAGGVNVFGEVPDADIVTEWGRWKPYGGHRLWTAPEANPRSYAPDDRPPRAAPEGERGIRVVQQADRSGIEKEMLVRLDPCGGGVSVEHRLVNRGSWTIETAPWAITILRPGGTVILPQEPYRAWEEELLPARPLVLWHYTDLSDPRWKIGPRAIRLTPDPSKTSPQKIGAGNRRGWAAYLSESELFVKRFAYSEGSAYPDHGSNCETYTAGSFVELESLGPLSRLEPGAACVHAERWELLGGVDPSADDAQIEALAKESGV